MSDVLARRVLNRTLLQRQLLLELVRRPVVEVVDQLVGMQAQAPRAPYVALWSRIEGFEATALETLIESRQAVRAIGMLRTTIHLLSAEDALALAPVVRPVWKAAFRHTPFRPNLEGIDLRDLGIAGGRLLDESPLTPTALGRRLAERWPGRDPLSLTMGVRDVTPIVQVPPRGLWSRTGPPAMARLERWLDRPISTSDDRLPFIRRYLAAFGPASTQDIATWSWFQGVRADVDRLRPELRVYRDESGRELFDLADAELADPDLPAPPRYLPEYDNILLSHRDRSRIQPPGWKMPLAAGDGGRVGTFLLDGFVGGEWRLLRRAEGATLRVEPIAPLSRPETLAVGDEAARLAAFLVPDAPVAVEIR